MEITDIRIRRVTDNSILKAYVTVTFDNCFVVHNIKIIKGQDVYFIAMPSRKTLAGEYKDVVHPITPEFRAEIHKKIFDKYYSENTAEDFPAEH
jgi:stage V sporulation protein G